MRRMIGPICRDEMRALTTAYTKATGRNLSQISRKYYGKSGFLARFLAGTSSMEIATFDSIMNQIRADLLGIERPEALRRAAPVDN